MPAGAGRGAAALLAVVWALSAAAPGPAMAVDDAELDALREAIEKARERVGLYERDERELLELLEEIDRSHERLAAELEQAQKQAGEARAVLARVRPRLRQVESQLGVTRQAMSRRAVALYKAGELGPVRVLFSATSLPDLLSGVSSLQRLLAYDAELVGRHRGERDSLRQIERETRAAQSRLDEALATQAARSRELEAERRAKRELLAAARGDRTRERGLLVELERAARALEETLTSLGVSRRDRDGDLDGSGFAERRGALRAPVDGSIRQGFGRVVDSEYQTETFRKGVEFAAASGDSVRAVASGEVRFAGWFRGYGKIVIVDHGDGYFSVSGHLEEIFVEVGDRVGDADSLGAVGETGSLSGPGLYFEIRRGGEPLDPRDWLQRTGAG